MITARYAFCKDIVKGATFTYLEKFNLHFSSSSFAIC